MTKKEHIIRYLNAGELPTAEIARVVGCSERYVQNVAKELTKQESRHDLTTENYINAILRGLDTKGKIAAFFEVNRRTLLRFETKNISKKTVSRFLYISGVEIETITHLFRLSTDEVNKLQKLPTIEEVRKQLRIISGILHPLKNESEDIAEKHSNVNALMWKI